ncbi:MAG: YkgJ family cysteine cluster protein [Lentisphaeria bacterium]|nr:YkgJ family cysteine cluster protein [Lentisphaeria bacterium]
MDDALLQKFQCLRCGKCCMWEGPVRVNEEEIEKIALFLNIPLKEFIEEHTVLAPDRKSLSLKEAPDGSCVYYDKEEHKCILQSVKPAQCKAFPFTWNFPGWDKVCEGGKALEKGSASSKDSVD